MLLEEEVQGTVVSDSGFRISGLAQGYGDSIVHGLGFKKV